MNRRNFFAVLAGALASIPMLGKPKPPMDYYSIDWVEYEKIGRRAFWLSQPGFNFYDLSIAAKPLYPEWTPEELDQ